MFILRWGALLGKNREENLKRRFKFWRIEYLRCTLHDFLLEKQSFFEILFNDINKDRPKWIWHESK